MLVFGKSLGVQVRCHGAPSLGRGKLLEVHFRREHTGEPLLSAYRRMPICICEGTGWRPSKSEKMQSRSSRASCLPTAAASAMPVWMIGARIEDLLDFATNGKVAQKGR